MPKIGEVVEKEEGVFEWTVRDFTSLPDQVDDRYESPSFSFGGERFYLVIYPNGERNKSEGYIGVFLEGKCSRPTATVTFYLDLKTTNNEIFQGTRTKDDSEDDFVRCDHVGKRFRRSTIFMRQPELAPSGHLIIVCRMRHVESTEAARDDSSASGFTVKNKIKYFETVAPK